MMITVNKGTRVEGGSSHLTEMKDATLLPKAYLRGRGDCHQLPGTEVVPRLPEVLVEADVILDKWLEVLAVELHVMDHIRPVSQMVGHTPL